MDSKEGIAAMKEQSLKAAADSDLDRKQALELGRYLEATIQDYIKNNGDIKAQVAIAAVDYVVKIYKERMSVFVETHAMMYGHLTEEIKKGGLKIHEPYANDGIDSKIAPVDPQGGQPAGGRILRPGE